MSGFSEQRQQLRNALVSAGLAPDAATQIANILGNSVQVMKHSGPVEVDTTPEDLRAVSPEQRKLRFPHLDFRPGDPDHRDRRTASSEERKNKEPEPNVVPIVAPQQTDANFRVAPGTLTDVSGTGASAQVNVRSVVAGAPPAGLPIAMLDAQANQIVGKAPRAQVGQTDGTARLDIQETGRELVWNLQMLNRSDYDVVTKVEFVDGVGLEVTYDRIKAWDQQASRVDTIPVVEQQVVSSIVDDRKGLRGRRRVIPVFSSRGATNTYFNTFRIGTFSGGWSQGTTKLVTQVWPTSDMQLTVRNLTHKIANTPGTKYVLFAPLTRSAVPVAAGDGQEVIVPQVERDEPAPVTSTDPEFDAAGELVEAEADGASEPEVEYYAIEIQNAGTTDDEGQCAVFHYLNGLTVQELVGYSASAPSALSYSTSGESATPCLRWRSYLVTVLADVALTAGGLTFTRKQLYVLGEGASAPPIVIPAAACPPPDSV